MISEQEREDHIRELLGQLDLQEKVAMLSGHGFVDQVTGGWYNRNLRIFANIHRIAEPGDRILVIIGAGHVPIIRHAFRASPEFRLIEVGDVLVP